MINSVTEDNAGVTVQQLSPREFEDFYRSHSDEIYRTLAVVLADHDLAREAVDEAMTRAFERWRSIRRYDNPSGWVYRVALNWARSHFRKRRREVIVNPGGPVWFDTVPDPALSSAVGRLPLHHREVIVFRFLLDMTLEQLADVLNIPVGTAKSRLHRALATLREEVNDDT